MAKKEDSKNLGLLRESQILELLPMSKSTFRRLVKSGKFPAGFKMTGRITVWRSQVVFDWINLPRFAGEDQ